MRENAASKARRYLSEGRLIVTRCTDRTVAATCRGDGTVYLLGYQHGTWHCTCPARGRCAHLLALGLVAAPDLNHR